MGNYGSKELLAHQPAGEQPHIGQVIRAILKQKNMTVRDLKAPLGRKGGAIYYHLRQKYLPVPLLLRLSEILDVNLLQYYQPKISQPNRGAEDLKKAMNENDRLSQELTLLKKENEVLREVIAMQKK